MKNNKVIEVSWGKPKGGEYISEIQINVEDREGILAESMEIISNSKTSLYAVNAKPPRNGVALINIKLKISDIENLKDVIKKIKKLKGVIDVYRAKN